MQVLTVCLFTGAANTAWFACRVFIVCAASELQNILPSRFGVDSTVAVLAVVVLLFIFVDERRGTSGN